MKKLIGFLLVASGLLLVANSVSAAEVEVYPGGVGTQANTTSAGWTDNHLVGQSFTPQNINKVTKIKLTNFKLGSGQNDGKGGGNLGGIISVALFQGEPTASTVPGGDGAGNTTLISPSGAMLTKISKIFIPGELANKVANLCGVPENTIEAVFLKRMRVNNPSRPCPRFEEWDRVYTLFSDAQQGMRDEWFNTFNIGTSYERHARFSGESDLLWSQTLPDYKSQPSNYEGPDWKSQTVSWQGTDSADNYLEVTLPTHSLVPGQPYFLSIQQSHLDQNRGTEEGGYYEQGRYNCERPNETQQIDLYGLDKSNNTETRLTGTTFCGKGNVFVAWIDINNPYNPYLGGRAYFNTVYYMNPGSYNRETGDLTYLKIWGNQAFFPTASITGPALLTTGQIGTYSGTATDLDGNLASGEIWLAKTDWSSPTTWGCTTQIIGSWCNIAGYPTPVSLSGGGPTSFSGNWTPSAAGTYYVPVNAFDSSGLRCTGNPQYSFNGGTIVRTDWSDCGANDYLTVTVSEALKITNTRIDITNNPDVAVGFRGAEKTSGRQAADGGANWYNYLRINEKVTATKPASEIDVVMVAFVPQPVQVGPSPSTKLGYVLQQANQGFVVAYAQCGTDKTNCGGFNLTAGHYYVYYNGAWRDMDNPDVFGIRNLCVDKNNNISNSLCNPTSGKFQVTAKPDTKPGTTESNRVQTADNSLDVKWDVYTWPSFTSRQLETYAYGRIGNVDAFDVAEGVIQFFVRPTATLTANPSTITRGQSTTLTWSSTNATKCILNPPGVWKTVEPSGTDMFSPTETTTYNLRCEGPEGPVNSVTTSTTVTVTQ